MTAQRGQDSLAGLKGASTCLQSGLPGRGCAAKAQQQWQAPGRAGSVTSRSGARGGQTSHGQQLRPGPATCSGLQGCERQQGAPPCTGTADAEPQRMAAAPGRAAGCCPAALRCPQPGRPPGRLGALLRLHRSALPAAAQGLLRRRQPPGEPVRGASLGGGL